MKIHDLSQTISDGMPVWPGDPETKLTIVQTIPEHSWELRYLQIATHTGTHVNVPAHMVEAGRTLDNYQPEVFMGPAQVVSPEAPKFPTGIGLLFAVGTVDDSLLEKIRIAKPTFIGVGESCEFEVETERTLLQEGILSFENLANLDQLPAAQTVQFIGLPLKLQAGDGSPVRAIALVEE